MNDSHKHITCLAILLLAIFMLASFPFALSQDIQVAVSPTNGKAGTEIMVTITNWPDTNFLPTAIYMQDIAEEGSRWNLLPVDPNTNWGISGNTLTRSYMIYPLAIEGSNKIMVGGVGGGSLAEANFDVSTKVVIDNGEISGEGAELSSVILQGAVSAVAGFGLVSFFKYYFERFRKKDTEKFSPTIKETKGVSKGEEVIRLKNQDVDTRYARKLKHYKYLRKILRIESEEQILQGCMTWRELDYSVEKEIDEKYESFRNNKGITWKQEFKEIINERPKFMKKIAKKYVYEKTMGKTEPNVDALNYIEKNLAPEQLKEFNQWMEHVNSHRRRAPRQDGSAGFGTSFAAAIGALG